MPTANQPGCSAVQCFLAIGLTKYIVLSKLPSVSISYSPYSLRVAAIDFEIFEVENSTRLINCIPRLANLTEKLPNLNIPIYIVIPDNIYSKAEKSFNDPSHQKLLKSDKNLILYSTLFDNLDLLDTKQIAVKDFLNAVSIKM